MQVPAPFEYERATSLDDALERLQRLGPEARVIAGGHSLLPMMKLRLAAPEFLVDVNDLTELDYIALEDPRVRIGALTRHRTLLESDELAVRFPIIRDAERVIADPPVRNRGTIGGALCQADPSEDLMAACAALKARIAIRGASGGRIVDMHEFRRGPYETAVQDGEMLVEVLLDVRPGHGSAYEKVKRRTGDWAIAATAAALWIDGDAIVDAGIALTAVGGPVTCAAAEQFLRGANPTVETFAEAAALAAADCDPVADQRGPEDYKRHLAHELTRRALERAAERAQRKEP